MMITVDLSQEIFGINVFKALSRLRSIVISMLCDRYNLHMETKLDVSLSTYHVSFHYVVPSATAVMYENEALVTQSFYLKTLALLFASYKLFKDPICFFMLMTRSH